MQPRLALSALALGIALPLGGCDCAGSNLRPARAELVAEPNPLDFGVVYPGLTAERVLTVRNAGDLALVVSATGVKPGSNPGLRVAELPFTIPPGGEHALSVRLTVGAAQPVMGVIWLESNDLKRPHFEVPVLALGAERPGPAALVCVESADAGLAENCVEPLEVDFGTHPIGSTRRATVRLRSVGSAPLILRAAQADPGSSEAFAFAPFSSTATLAPGEERRFVAAWTPASEDPVAATFAVQSNDPDRPRIPVLFEARGVDAALCADPPSIDFGAVTIAREVSTTVRLTSCGRAPIDLLQLALTGSPDIRRASEVTLPTTLAPGEGVDVELHYLPMVRGTQSARLEVTTSGRQTIVPLAGHTVSCDLVASAMGLSFGAVASGQSKRLSVLLENAGAEDCSVQALSLRNGPEFMILEANRARFTIAPGAAEMITIAYQPVDPGADSAALEVYSDDPDEPLLSLSLSGRRSEPGDCLLMADPDPINFGVVRLGDRATAQVRVTNAGQTSCTVAGVRMSATSGPDFGVSGNLMPPILRPLDSFLVELSFQPERTRAQLGELEILSSHSGERTASIQVSGAGQGARLCISPPRLVFGTRAPSQPGALRSLSLTACGSEPVVISSAQFQRGTSAEYRLPSPPSLPIAIPAGLSIQLDVGYMPVDPGRDDGLLIIESNDAVEAGRAVPLIGAGGSGCGDVQGRICGLGSQAPVSGALVFVDGPTGRITATTDDQGEFVLTCVVPGTARIRAQSGNWSTSFTAMVSDGQTTQLPSAECLDPMSARVAVVWGEWDHMESILGTIGIPYAFYGQNEQARLLLDPAELARYDIVFLNCGMDDSLLSTSPGTGLLQSFVAMGGSVYGSDWAYDPLERAWPAAIDFVGDDAVRDAAQNAGSFSGPVQVRDPSLRAALGGRRSVDIASCCTAMDAPGAQTTVYLQGDRLGDHRDRPFFVGFRPAPSGGTVMYTDFHNNGQPDILEIFRWLIARL
ncbi:MAG: choice-of-anchor D domain-containing protein [Myxococcota bacterium]